MDMNSYNDCKADTSIIILNMQSALQDSEHIKTDAKCQCRNDGWPTW